MKKTSLKTRVHDGIVGSLLFSCIAGAHYLVMPILLLVPAVVTLVMFQSAFTGFCPVYFVLDQVMKD